MTINKQYGKMAKRPVERQPDFFKHFFYSSVVYNRNFPNAVISRSTKEECIEDAKMLIQHDRLKMIARIEICEYREKDIPHIVETITHESQNL